MAEIPANAITRDKDGALARAILDDLGDAVSVAAGTECVYVNDAYLGLYGLTDPSQAIGRAIDEHVANGDKLEVVRRALAIQRGEILGHLYEYRIRTRAGTERVVQVRGMPLTWYGRAASLSVQRDVTDRVRVERELRRAISLNKATLESTADGILVMDLDRRVVDFNSRFVEMWGLDREVMLVDIPAGVKFKPILDQVKDADEFEARSRAVYSSPEESSLDVLHLEDGRIIERFSLPHRLGDETVGRVWSFRDITANHSLQLQLRHSAFHDGLTGLANRASFTDRVDHAIALCHRTQSEVFLLFVDLDNFKSINDRLGHSTGDRVLSIIARRIVDSLRSADTAARLGGDEFAVLLENPGGIDEAVKVAERVLAVIRAPLFLDEREIVVEASIGIAAGDGNSSSEELVRNADVAMYAAKAAGKGNLHVYEQGMQRHVAERQSLIAELKHAIPRGELVIEYQPCFQLRSHRMIAAEALVRWRHPTRGLLSPDQFVHLAEESALIGAIGEYVLVQSCRVLADWQVRFPESRLLLGVNVSARQLRDSSFADCVRQTVEQEGIDPGRLLLEITESAVIEDRERGVKALRELKEIGVVLALDDFGTGYSSLSYLRDLPIDVLKIDRSFVSNVATSHKEALVTGATIALGHELGLWIIAEGIERTEQLDKLLELQCEFGQGYLFSPPLSREQLEEFVAAQSGNLGLSAA